MPTRKLKRSVHREIQFTANSRSLPLLQKRLFQQKKMHGKSNGEVSTFNDVPENLD
jgi:hypothetical protein